MRSHGTALWRWATIHRRRLAAVSALAAVTSLLITLSPLLLSLAAVEWKFSRRRGRLLSLTVLSLLTHAAVWLWRDLRGEPQGRWRPCARCGRPIEEPSRAAYCSHPCRRYARLERDAQAADPWIAQRASRRLRALEPASAEGAFGEVPF